VGCRGAAIFIRFCDSSAVVIAFWRLFFSVLFLLPLSLKKEIRDQFKPLTHTVAYTIRGILEIGIATENEYFINTASKSANIVFAIAFFSKSYDFNKKEWMIYYLRLHLLHYYLYNIIYALEYLL